MDPSIARSLVAYALLELASSRREQKNSGISVADIAERAGVSLSLACASLKRLEEVAGRRIRLYDCSSVDVGEFFELALLLVSSHVVAPEKAARLLDWREFEEFSARVLQSYGYRVYRGVYKPPPRGFQVDVLAIAPTYRYSIVVDCKHWDPRYSSPSRLKKAAVRHAERVKLLAAYWTMARGLKREKKPKALLPVIIVLRENAPRLVEGVVVVPASRLRGFLESIELVIEDERVRLIRPE